MADSLDITVETIIHATEDSSKFLDAFEENLGLPRKEFSAERMAGHYDNPIVMLCAKLQKKPARDLLGALLSKLSPSQKASMIEEIEARTAGSKFHLRLGKQEFLNGMLRFEERDAIRLRIHMPVYSKKDTTGKFKRLFLQLD